MTLLRRIFLWLFLLTTSAVVIGVFLQAFSIAAYARGAGSDALDLHTTVGFLVHSIEIVVFLTALVAFWGMWRLVGLAALLPGVGLTPRGSRGRRRRPTRPADRGRAAPCGVVRSARTFAEHGA
jgi:hypothetical protein